MDELALDPKDLWPSPWSELFFPSLDVDPGAGPVKFPDAARSRHFVCYGGTGKGKSRFLEGLFVGDVARRVARKSPRGVGVIDVMGDLYRNLRARLSMMALKFPHLEEMVYLIDPINPSWSVRYNPLELKQGEGPEKLADRLAYGVTTLYHDDPHVTVRLYRVLKHSLLALILARRSLPELPRFLQHDSFRDEILSGCRHPALDDYFGYEFPKKEQDIRELVESTLNRMDLVFDPDVAEFLTGPSTIDFRRFLDEGTIVLVNLPKAKMGEGASYLLAAFVLLEFQRAAMTRLDLPDGRRRPFSLLCDEYQNYTTDTILSIIKETRKVVLELGLVTQDVAGRPEEAALRTTIRKVAGNIICFGLDHGDAETLVKDVFIPSLDQSKDVRVRYQKVPGLFGEYTRRFDDVLYRPIEEVWEREIRKLTGLPDRWFWWKHRGQSCAYLVETPNVADIEELAPADVVATALAAQEAAAFRLAGRPKFKKLPTPTTSSHSNIWGP